MLEECPEFTGQALVFMSANALANPIGKCLYALYSSTLESITGNVKTSEISEDTSIRWTNQWAPKTRTALINSKTREHVQTYFLPQMFKRLPASLKNFIKPFMDIKPDTPEAEISALVGCLKIGQELNILDLSNRDNKIISPEFLESLFYHNSPSLRISALSLAVTSPQVSKPIAPYVLEIIKRSIDNFFVESDPGFRNQFYGFMRQMVFRVRGSAYAMARESRKLKERDDLEKAKLLDEQIENIKNFCAWLVGYLEHCIRPGTSYQYLFTGILVITLLVQSGLDERVSSKYYEKQHTPFPFHVSVYNHRVVRLLIDNIANNYEDIRSGAAKILKMAPLPVPQVETYDDIEAISSQVYNTISGMRGREGDAGARGAELVFHLYSAFPTKDGDSIAKPMEFFEHLLANLEQHVEYAQNDLPTAVREHPIHGYYSAVRFIIESIDFKQFIINDQEVERWKRHVKRLVDSIFEIWNVVKSILCHDSPEGNLPEEFESNFQPDLEAQYGAATQVILSYSWRAVKESTSLLNALLDRIPSNSVIFPNSLVLDAGEVILTQLASVHHRGAFSSVYPTFISCCKRCNRTKELEDQPAKWLTDNLALIKIKAQYITRRSGGLPFLITAVLSAETDPGKPLLRQTFNNLYAIAKSPAVSLSEEKMDLPQVHAFNCIKALFVETELSSSSAYFVDQALELSITSFSHPIWAIRNCAVMLFTALQNRLFGTAKVSLSKHTASTVSARLFFSKYKTVRQVLLNILEQNVKDLELGDSNSSHIETVFPVLALLARLEGTNGYDGLKDFEPLILMCLKSKIWKTREMAARTLPPLLNDQDIVKFSTDLLQSTSCQNQNGLHGACLAVLNMILRSQEKNAESRKLESRASVESFPLSFIKFLFSKFDNFVVGNSCAETAQAYFRILKAIYTDLLGSHFEIPQEFESILIPYCSTEWAGKKIGLNAVERCLQSEMAHTVLLSVASKKSSYVEVVKKLILDSRYEVQQMAIAFLNEHLDSLNQDEARQISSACWALFKSASWDQVRGPAARLFSNIQTISKCDDSQAKVYWSTLSGSISHKATEEINESCLEAIGIFTGQLFNLSDSVAFTDKWLTLIKEYSHENQAFPARQAAINSLLSFLKSVTPFVESLGCSDKDPQLTKYLDALFQLLFFLSDDDEDIREAASAYTSELLKLPFFSTSVNCEKVLLQHICDIAAQKLLNEDLLSKLFDQFTSNQTASDQLKAAFTDDDLLFSFEKQNLYRDELRNVTLYFEAIETQLVNCPKDSEVCRRIASWIEDAVFSASQYIGPKTGPDGVLGWTKDPEVFLAFYRIQLGVKLGQNFKMLNSKTQVLLAQTSSIAAVVDMHTMLCL